MAAMVMGSLLILSFLSSSIDEAKAPAPKELALKAAAGDEKPAPKDGRGVDSGGVDSGKEKGLESPGPALRGEAPKPETGKDAPAPDAGKAAPKGDDPKAVPKPEAKAEPKAEPKQKAAPVAPPAPAPRPKPPIPQMKTPQAMEKFQEGWKKFETEDFTGARTVFNACLKDAATPADKKVLQAYIEDTKLGSEIEAARKMVEHKEERKAISRVEKALKANPTTYLRPEAEKFIRETEELIFLVLDDFEPGESLQKDTESRDSNSEEKDDPRSNRNSSTRWKGNHFYNSDPRFVKHGKVSMKWKVGGAYNYSAYSYYYDSYSYRSAELKNPITKWHALVFWIYMSDADEGSLRVSLSPTQEASVVGSLYSQKLVDLRGMRGWKEIRLDLNRDFGNTRNVKLDDIHYVRIEYLHIKSRTLYLDFVHFE